MSDHEKKASPECFSHLEKVFPLGTDGLRHSPAECLDCSLKTECLRAALKGEDGVAVHAERLERAYQAGSVGFIGRWAQQKTLNRRKSKMKDKSGLGRVIVIIGGRHFFGHLPDLFRIVEQQPLGALFGILRSRDRPRMDARHR